MLPRPWGRTVELDDACLSAVVRVVVELTEREKVEDGARLQANLAALQGAGIRIAVDDAGAGNAGLRLLSQMRS